MRQLFLSSLMLLVIGAGALASPGPQDATPRSTEYELLRPDLSRVRVMLRSLTATDLVARDTKGNPVRLSLGDVLALLPASESSSASVEQLGAARTTRERSDQGWLVLRDGQTIPGALSASQPAPAVDTLPWTTSRFGQLSFSLEDVALVRFVDASQTAALRGTRDDTVLLTNADRLTGFVSLTDGGMLSVETQPGKPVATPLARVAALAFANPPQPRTGTWVWLADGTSLRVTSLAAPDSQHVSFALASVEGASTFSLPADEMLAFTPAHERLVGLASLPAPSFTPGPARRWTPAPIVAPADESPLGAARIELPGPISATWQLPDGAVRFSAGVELPESCRVWGDCAVVLSADGKELARVQLTPTEPVATLTAALPARAQALTLTLDPGERGSVEDRVVLQRALLLLK